MSSGQLVGPTSMVYNHSWVKEKSSFSDLLSLHVVSAINYTLGMYGISLKYEDNYNFLDNLKGILTLNVGNKFHLIINYDYNYINYYGLVVC